MWVNSWLEGRGRKEVFIRCWCEEIGTAAAETNSTEGLNLFFITVCFCRSSKSFILTHEHSPWYFKCSNFCKVSYTKWRSYLVFGHWFANLFWLGEHSLIFSLWMGFLSTCGPAKAFDVIYNVCLLTQFLSLSDTFSKLSNGH